jgi:hypothetical protein
MSSLTRTTITQQNDMPAILKRYANSQCVSGGQTAGNLTPRAWRGEHSTRELNGSLLVGPPADLPVVRNKHARRLE